LPDGSPDRARTFVLVHGGGHGGWCWQRVARRLRALGHEVHTPTLTGFGERHHLGGADTPFDTFLADVANRLEFEDLRDVVLVGHSMGGVVVPRVAQLAADRIERVVWLAAVVCQDGETLLDAVPQTPATAAAVTIHADGTITQDNAKLIDAVLSDGTPQDRAWVLERHRTYPPAALVEPGRLTDFLALGLPTAYVVALRDATIPPQLAESFAGRLPGARHATVDAGHDCMISRPREVADALLAVTA
jgi:pimeloyl-ACP methyl ester carboxylesterase